MPAPGASIPEPLEPNNWRTIVLLVGPPKWSPELLRNPRIPQGMLKLQLVSTMQASRAPLTPAHLPAVGGLHEL